MNSKILIIGLIFLIALISGCTEIHQKKGFSLEYNRSGGIAGMSSSIAIDELGNIEINDSGETLNAKLSETELNELIELIQEKQFFSLPPDLDHCSNCADQFFYMLKITLNTQTRSTGGDMTIINQNFLDITRKLDEIIYNKFRCEWEPDNSVVCERALFPGYYFNKNTNQCEYAESDREPCSTSQCKYAEIRRGGRGPCSNPPFRTIQECQERCEGVE
ncbi:MAG: hypothetical protein ABIA76_02090 [Candidatus Diapherotrites archaeon]